MWIQKEFIEGVVSSAGACLLPVPLPKRSEGGTDFVGTDSICIRTLQKSAKVLDIIPERARLREGG